MEWVEEVYPFHLETLTTLRKYQQTQPSKQEWMRVELDETMNEMASRTKKAEKATKYIPLTRRYYLQVKLYKAAKADRLLGVAERTGQQWAKRSRDEDEWDISVMIRYNHLFIDMDVPI
ncbi:hypothetical protein PS15m_003486 [Mucor circinelloides]